MTNIERLKNYGWNFEGKVGHKEWRLNIGSSDEPYIVDMQIDFENKRAYFNVKHKNIEKRHEIDFNEALLHATEGNLFKDLQNPFKEEIILSYKSDNNSEIQITKVLSPRFKSIMLDEGEEEYFIRKIKRMGESLLESYEKIDKGDVEKILNKGQNERESLISKFLE
ncbi:hypothetical protein Thena_1577 [Thermodesulfobium narugense DSM 14796]|uniref:Uncharacterized protein n=1 Tax=Thermodesulfobium narugense DSM 14796 TaxID=747365 RepID=M1E9F5_9BACT|nr:hypothetical protein [Thermodesulfobium narugense]AEE15189.1 hypothetical protein Thena_1577 [Thermodesulfobium narugense DSM 14796]